MKKILCTVLVSSFFCGSVLADDKAFHPTDALLIGGNGPFNAKPDEEDEVDLGLDGWSWW